MQISNLSHPIIICDCCFTISGLRKKGILLNEFQVIKINNLKIKKALQKNKNKKRKVFNKFEREREGGHLDKRRTL